MLLPPLISGTLRFRYKRFLAEIILDDGKIVQAHCPNSGSMLGCQEPGSQVWLSYHPSPKRKYPYTWELVRVGQTWVGINTMVPNRIVREAVAAEKIPSLRGYTQIRSEVRIGEHSRLDLQLRRDDEICFIELKNVTLVQGGIAFFPDAVTERGRRHLWELQRLVRSGARGIIFFVVQREDARIFSPAWQIDRKYAQELVRAHENGVEIMVYQATVNPSRIDLSNPLPFTLDESQSVEGF